VFIRVDSWIEFSVRREAVLGTEPLQQLPHELFGPFDGFRIDALERVGNLMPVGDHAVGCGKTRPRRS